VALTRCSEMAPIFCAAPMKTKDSAEDVLLKMLNQFIVILNNNHGIMEKNLKMLVVPAGVRLSDLDQQWLVDLNEFGKHRGEIAHKTVGVHRPINPKDELDKTQSILKGLKRLDRLVLKLRV
jgi:hypothetical protein